MKKLLLVILTLLLVSSALAANKFESVIVARIYMVGPEHVLELHRLGIDVDRCTTNPPGVVTVNVSVEEFELLKKLGYAIKEIPNYAKL